MFTFRRSFWMKKNIPVSKNQNSERIEQMQLVKLQIERISLKQLVILFGLNFEAVITEKAFALNTYTPIDCTNPFAVNVSKDTPVSSSNSRLAPSKELVSTSRSIFPPGGVKKPVRCRTKKIWSLGSKRTMLQNDTL